MNKKENKKKAEKRVVVYFDGSNFYHKLRSIGVKNVLKFDYQKFSLWLVRQRNLVACRYYVGVVKPKNKDEKGQKLRKNQQRFFAHLEKQGILVKKGQLMKSGGVYHEKGVDVKIATDLLVGAYENLYDVAVLISSDTDLVPAVEKVKALGKQVEYIGFAHNPCFGLQKCATLSRLLIREEFEGFEIEEKN